MDFFTNLFTYPTTSTSSLQSSGNLSKEQFLRFSSSCVSHFTSSEFKQELKAFVSNGKDPNEVIADKQKHVFEMDGVQGDFGLQQLRTISNRFRTDGAVQKSFMGLVTAEDKLLDEMELTPEEFEMKLGSIRLAEAAQAEFLSFMMSLPEDQRMEFQRATAEAGSRAASQTPASETMSQKEGQAMMIQQITLVKQYLVGAGYKLPGGVSSYSTQAPGVGAASSMMTAAEQARFFESTLQRP